MFDLKELKLCINTLKKTNNKLYSNTILMNDELEKLSLDSDTFLYFSDEVVCIFIKENGFYRMYYYTNSPYDCRCIKDAIIVQKLDMPVIIDVFGKQSKIKEHVNAMEDIGCDIFASYHRWQRKADETNEFPFDYASMSEMFSGVEVGYANTSDIDEAVRIINDSFDPFIAYVSDRNKITKAVANNELFSIRQDGRLTGIFCVEVLGNNVVFLHSLVVDKETDGSALGVLLFTYTLETYPKGTAFSCWIDDVNHKSIRIAKKFKFIRDVNMGYYIIKYM